MSLAFPFARWPGRTTLEGRHTTLVPLDAAVHTAPLFPAIHGPANQHVWGTCSTGPLRTPLISGENLAKKAATDDPLFFSILDRETSRAVGYASYMRIEPVHRVIEVGSILYTPLLQQTTGATEAMYLMARHVFEELGYRRYEWKCNALNRRRGVPPCDSGFTFEGIFRQHMIVKGRSRDTAWFSMLDSRMAGPQGRVRTLARSGQLRCRGPAARRAGQFQRVTMPHSQSRRRLLQSLMGSAALVSTASPLRASSAPNASTPPQSSAPQTATAGDLPLQQFEPRSMLRVAETPVDKARFPVVDMHTHVTRRARVSAGVSLAEPITLNAPVDDVLALMDARNVRTMVNLTGGYGSGLVESVRTLQQPHPDRFVVFTEPAWYATAEPGYAQWQADELATCAQ